MTTTVTGSRAVGSVEYVLSLGLSRSSGSWSLSAGSRSMPPSSQLPEPPQRCSSVAGLWESFARLQISTSGSKRFRMWLSRDCSGWLIDWGKSRRVFAVIRDDSCERGRAGEERRCALVCRLKGTAKASVSG